MSKRDLDESFVRALSAARARKVGSRLPAEAVEALGVRVEETQEQQALEDLRRYMPEGQTIFLILRHRATSGMQREIGLVVFKGGQVIHPNHAVSRALGLRLNKESDGVVVRGAGMDMGLHVVSHISQKLYGNSTSLKHRWL